MNTQRKIEFVLFAILLYGSEFTPFGWLIVAGLVVTWKLNDPEAFESFAEKKARQTHSELADRVSKVWVSKLMDKIDKGESLDSARLEYEIKDEAIDLPGVLPKYTEKVFTDAFKQKLPEGFTFDYDLKCGMDSYRNKVGEDVVDRTVFELDMKKRK